MSVPATSLSPYSSLSPASLGSPMSGSASAKTPSPPHFSAPPHSTPELLQLTSQQMFKKLDDLSASPASTGAFASATAPARRIKRFNSETAAAAGSASTSSEVAARRVFKKSRAAQANDDILLQLLNGQNILSESCYRILTTQTNCNTDLQKVREKLAELTQASEKDGIEIQQLKQNFQALMDTFFNYFMNNPNLHARQESESHLAAVAEIERKLQVNAKTQEQSKFNAEERLAKIEAFIAGLKPEAMMLPMPPEVSSSSAAAGASAACNLTSPKSFQEKVDLAQIGPLPVLTPDPLES